MFYNLIKTIKLTNEASKIRPFYVYINSKLYNNKQTYIYIYNPPSLAKISFMPGLLLLNQFVKL